MFLKATKAWNNLKRVRDGSPDSPSDVGCSHHSIPAATRTPQQSYTGLCKNRDRRFRNSFHRQGTATDGGHKLPATNEIRLVPSRQRSDGSWQQEGSNRIRMKRGEGKEPGMRIEKAAHKVDTSLQRTTSHASLPGWLRNYLSGTGGTGVRSGAGASTGGCGRPASSRSRGPLRSSGGSGRLFFCLRGFGGFGDFGRRCFGGRGAFLPGESP